MTQVEELRRLAATFERTHDERVVLAAADTIERQAAEIARMYLTLNLIGSGCTTRPEDIYNPTVLWMQTEARKTLEDTNG